MFIYKYRECLVFITIFSYGAVARPATANIDNTVLDGHAKDTLTKQTLKGAVAGPVDDNTDNTIFAFPDVESPRKPTLEAIPQGPHGSPIAYRKAFTIKIPLKPKLFKHIHYLRKKNQSAKRDTKYYGQHKHVPFIKSINMLLSSLLHSGADRPDSQGSDSENGNKSHKLRIRKPELDQPKQDNNTAQSKERTNRKENKKAINTTTASAPEISCNPKNTTEATFGRTVTGEVGGPEIPAHNASSSVSVLPAANSTDGRRGDDRHTSGSGPTNYTDANGSLSRDNRHAGHASTVTPLANVSESIPEHSNDTSRNHKDGSVDKRQRGNERGTSIDGQRAGSGNGNSHTKDSAERSSTFGDINQQLAFKNQIETRRDKLNGIKKRFRIRPRGRLTASKENDVEESVQSNDDNGKSIISDATSDSDNQQHAGRNGTVAELSESSGYQEINTKDIEYSIQNAMRDTTQLLKPIEILSGYSNLKVDSGTNV